MNNPWQIARNNQVCENYLNKQIKILLFLNRFSGKLNFKTAINQILKQLVWGNIEAFPIIYNRSINMTYDR